MTFEDFSALLVANIERKTALDLGCDDDTYSFEGRVCECGCGGRAQLVWFEGVLYATGKPVCQSMDLMSMLARIRDADPSMCCLHVVDGGNFGDSDIAMALARALHSPRCSCLTAVLELAKMDEGAREELIWRFNGWAPCEVCGAMHDRWVHHD